MQNSLIVTHALQTLASGVETSSSTVAQTQFNQEWNTLVNMAEGLESMNNENTSISDTRIRTHAYNLLERKTSGSYLTKMNNSKSIINYESFKVSNLTLLQDCVNVSIQNALNDLLAIDWGSGSNTPNPELMDLSLTNEEVTERVRFEEFMKVLETSFVQAIDESGNFIEDWDSPETNRLRSLDYSLVSRIPNLVLNTFLANNASFLNDILPLQMKLQMPNIYSAIRGLEQNIIDVNGHFIITPYINDIGVGLTHFQLHDCGIPYIIAMTTYSLISPNLYVVHNPFP